MFQTTLYFMRLLSVQTESTLLIGATFQAASRQLRAFALVFAVLFVSLGSLGLLLFGVHVLQFRTFLRSLETIFCIMLGTARVCCGLLARTSTVLYTVQYIAVHSKAATHGQWIAICLQVSPTWRRWPQ